MPYVRLLWAQLAIGAAAIFARYALLGAGPLAVSALRLSVAALLALALARGGVWLGRGREASFGAAGLALAIHFAAWIASLAYTSVAVSTLLVTTTPLWTEAYDVVRGRRSFDRAFAAATILALCGGWSIGAARASAPPPVPGHALAGDALALVGAIAIGAYLLIVRDAGSDGAARLATRHIVARTYGWAALALSLAALGAREGPPAVTNLPAWGGVFAMALISQSLGHTALNAALSDFSPSTIALTTLLEPAIAALLAAAVFHETLSAQMLIGGLLILAAVGTTLITTRIRPES